MFSFFLFISVPIYSCLVLSIYYQNTAGTRLFIMLLFLWLALDYINYFFFYPYSTWVLLADPLCQKKLID